MPVDRSASSAQAAPHLLGHQAGPSPIRRLNRTEYNNTIRDLLGDTTRPADAFVREEEQGGFNNNAEALGVTPILAEQYMRASEAIASARPRTSTR